ncbi:unnamed protein product [Blepharisma stoltei]|uniref:Uncharacterized protein n=1 Tax=Blepharisma stoltei TaxID=1481888 RepID=A0AAU9J642_9CILI|nr:unnamed protein product [Blepharisma stoltei]
MVDHFIKELKEKEAILDTRLIEWVHKIHPVNQFIRKNFTDPNYESQILNKNNKMAAYRKGLVSEMLGKRQAVSLVSSPTKMKKTWISRPKSGKAVNKHREMELIQQIKFETKNSITELLGSGVNLYKGIAEISSHFKIHTNMPETLIFGYGFDSPTLLYTNDDGILQAQQKLSISQIEIVIQILETWRLCNYSGVACPLCIVITPNSQYNKIVMRENELKYEIKNSYKNDLIIQRYILPKGRKASKIRIVWTSKDLKIYKITNIDRMDGKKEQNPLDSVYYINKTIDTRKKYGSEGTPLTNHIKVSKNNLEQYNKLLENVEILITKEKKTKSTTHSSEQKSRDAGWFEHDYDDKAKNFPSKLLNKSMFDQHPSKGIHKKSNSSQKIKSADEDLHAYIKDSILGFSPPVTIKKLYQNLFKIPHLAEEDEEFSCDGCDFSHNFGNKLRNMYCTDFLDPDKSAIYEIKCIKSYEKAIKQLHEVRKAVNSFLVQKENKTLSQLVLDFAEDQSNNFYFLKIKAFQCEQKINKTIHQKQKNLSFICQGKHCSNSVSDSQFFGNDSLNFTTDFDKSGKFLILRGNMIDDKNEEKDLSQMLNPRLYERVPVCRNCYNTYKLRDKGNISQYQKTILLTKNKEKKQKNIEQLIEEINPLIAEKCTESSNTDFLLKRSESLPFRRQAKAVKSEVSQPPCQTKLNKVKSSLLSPKSTQAIYFKKKMIEIRQAANELEFPTHLNKTSLI